MLFHKRFSRNDLGPKLDDRQKNGGLRVPVETGGQMGWNSSNALEQQEISVPTPLQGYNKKLCFLDPT